MDLGVVLPVLITSLTDSKIVLGLFSTIQRAGGLLPQLLGAVFVLRHARRKPFVVYPCLVSRIPFYVTGRGAPSSLGGASPGAVSGSCSPPTRSSISGKDSLTSPGTISSRAASPRPRRGRFFGSLQAFGGLLAVGSGLVVRHVLSRSASPSLHSFGVLFVLLCIGMTCSTFFLALMREPEGEESERPQSLVASVRAIPRALREHPRLRRLILGQNLCGLAALAIPFYAVYAYQRLGIPAATSGLFIAAGVIGTVGGGLSWAYLCDRLGSTRVIRSVSLVLILMPAAALAVPVLARTLGIAPALPYLYALVFVFGGSTAGGAWMGFTTYVMEISPEEQRPILLGLQSTLGFPTGDHADPGGNPPRDYALRGSIRSGDRHRNHRRALRALAPRAAHGPRPRRGDDMNDSLRPPREPADPLFRLGRAMFYALFRSFNRLEISGREHVPPQGGVLIIANHTSYADPPLVGAAFPRPVHFMAKAGSSSSPWARSSAVRTPSPSGAGRATAARSARRFPCSKKEECC